MSNCNTYESVISSDSGYGSSPSCTDTPSPPNRIIPSYSLNTVEIVPPPGLYPTSQLSFAQPALPSYMWLTQDCQARGSDRPFKCDQCPRSFNRNHDL